MWLTALSLKKQNLNEEYISQLKKIVAISEEQACGEYVIKAILKL